MSKSKQSDTKADRKKLIRWIITIFITTVLISAAISYISDEIMENSSIFVAFAILLLIVFVGIIFDVIGVAVASADEKPFHSMAARKVPGAQEAIALLRNAERTSSICNDVIGDICGVISGSASATIAAQVLRVFEFSWPQLAMLIMSALVAGLTVGGKAVGKSFAMNSCTRIVHSVGRVVYVLRHFPDAFRKKKIVR